MRCGCVPVGVGYIADLMGPDFAGEAGVWLDVGQERARIHGPLAGCVAVLRAVLDADDRAERIACLLSDVVLARTFNWKRVLPVSAKHLTKTALRDLTANGQGAELAVQARILESIEGTIRMTRDLVAVRKRFVPWRRLDVSRFRAAPGARLSDFPFECDRAFPTQC